MKKIAVIAAKDIIGTLTNRYELIFFLLLPVLFTVVTGVGLGGNNPEEAAADTRFEVLVVDLDQSELSASFARLLQESDVVRPENATEQEAAAQLEEQQAAAVLTIPAGFGETALSGGAASIQLKELPDASQALAIEEAVRAASIQFGSSLAAAQASVDQASRQRPFESPEEQASYFDQGLEMAQSLASDPPVTINVVRPETTRQSVTGFEQASAGQLVTWTLITMIGAAEVFVDERIGGTLSRLLTTPTRRGTIVAGKIGGRLALGLIQMAILIGFGALALKVSWGRSWPALILVIIAFALAAVSLGVMVSPFLKTRSQAGWVVVMISMLSSALGGAWWPLEITPPTYQTVVKVLPTTWAMTGFTDVIVRGQGVAGVLPEVGVLLLFALVFLVIGIRRLKFE